jgi:hypothetical protein
MITRDISRNPRLLCVRRFVSILKDRVRLLPALLPHSDLNHAIHLGAADSSRYQSADKHHPAASCFKVEIHRVVKAIEIDL